MTITVDAPDGTRWTIRRRWLPSLGSETVGDRFRRRRRGFGTRAEVADGAIDVGLLADVPIIGGVAVVISLLGLIALLVLVVVPILLLIAELALLVLLTLALAGGRVLLRRPWVVEAVDQYGRALRWRSVGWQASGERLSEIADLLRAGVTPPDAQHVPAPTR